MPRRRWDDNIKTDLENRMTGKEQGFICLERQTTGGFCEQGDEPCSIKRGKFLISCSTISTSRTLLHRGS